MCTRCLSVSFRFGLRLFHFTKKSFIKVFCVCVFRFSFFGVFRLSYGGCVSLSLSALCVNVRFEFFFVEFRLSVVLLSCCRELPHMHVCLRLLCIQLCISSIFVYVTRRLFLILFNLFFLCALKKCIRDLSK